MAKRKGVSNRVRFDVFKRDRFTCQYCGGRPPAVVLQIDHFIPVASGGTNDMENLVTSCQECNNGKSDGDLRQVPPSLEEQMTERRERAAQVEAYNQFLLEEREREQDTVEMLGRYWFNKASSPKDRDRYVLAASPAASIKTFLEHLTPVEIMGAMDIAHGRFPFFGEWSSRTWRYFCGICWNKIKGDRGA